ncbi:nonribosomal peptide synthetase [Lysinibacillus sp. KU-BSD001]|uniref:SF0329 family protein n=1 Tax=Lysinibacillus sp. KU-BSD001 TaxID=3141328 RepID=UPI0036EFEFFA
MQWSKTKAILEGFLCEKLKKRIQLHATVYRIQDSPGRVWITFDKKEILSASDLTFAVKHGRLYEQMKAEANLSGIPYNQNWEVMFQSKERQALVGASDHAEEILMRQSIFESYHLYAPLMNYSHLSIEEALKSENSIIRAFSMFDKRLGKRTLKKLYFTEGTHPLVMKFYNIRCAVEGVQNVFLSWAKG